MLFLSISFLGVSVFPFLFQFICRLVPKFSRAPDEVKTSSTDLKHCLIMLRGYNKLGACPGCSRDNYCLKFFMFFKNKRFQSYKRPNSPEHLIGWGHRVQSLDTASSTLQGYNKSGACPGCSRDGHLKYFFPQLKQFFPKLQETNMSGAPDWMRTSSKEFRYCLIYVTGV